MAYRDYVIGLPSIYAHYPLNEASGSTVLDVAGNARNGTIVANYNTSAPVNAGGGYGLPGFAGPAAIYLGSGSTAQYVRPDQGYTGNTWTIMGWIRRRALGATLRHVEFYASASQTYYERYFTMTTGSASGYKSDLTVGGYTLVSSGVVPNSNAWIHVAFTQDGTNATLYINGVQQVTSVGTSNHMYELAGEPLPALGNVGEAQEVSYFTSVLTASQIQSAYNAASPQLVLGAAARVVGLSSSLSLGAHAFAEGSASQQLGAAARAQGAAPPLALGASARAAAPGIATLTASARVVLHGSETIGGAARAIAAATVGLYARARAIATGSLSLGAAARAQLPVHIVFGAAARAAIPAPTVASSRISADAPRPMAAIGTVELTCKWGGDLVRTPQGDLRVSVDTFDQFEATDERLTRLVMNDPLIVDAAGTVISMPDDPFHDDWGSGARVHLGELVDNPQDGSTGTDDEVFSLIRAAIESQLATDPVVAYRGVPTVTVTRIDELSASIVIDFTDKLGRSRTVAQTLTITPTQGA